MGIEKQNEGDPPRSTARKEKGGSLQEKDEASSSHGTKRVHDGDDDNGCRKLLNALGRMNAVVMLSSSGELNYKKHLELNTGRGWTIRVR